MNRREMIKNNPLRLLNPDMNGEGVAQRMGLVIARAGLGKTAILVQIALDSLMRGNKVLHVSIGQSFEKTKIWYEDIFKDLAQNFQLDNAAEVLNEILPNRMIMTFNVSSFSRPKLEERLNDLVYQNIFRPNYLVIDGFDFEALGRQALVDLRELMEAMDLHMWFSAVSHRDDERKSTAGVPAPCHEVDDLFDTIIALRPESQEKSIGLDIVKDATGSAEPGMHLNFDPSTLIIKKA